MNFVFSISVLDKSSCSSTSALIFPLRISFKTFSCDGKRFISCPDSLPIVDAKTGYGVTPWEEDFYVGREVLVLTMDAPPIWQSEQGLKIFGPQVFEPLWTEYTPVRELLSKSSGHKR